MFRVVIMLYVLLCTVFGVTFIVLYVRIIILLLCEDI